LAQFNLNAVFLGQPQERRCCIRMAGCLGETREYRGLSAVIVRIGHEKSPSASPAKLRSRRLVPQSYRFSTTNLAEQPAAVRK
jgi:hypothetical protein